MSKEAVAALEKTIDILECLSVEKQSVLWERMREDPALYSRFLVSIGALTDNFCGNHNKLYEVVETLRLYEIYDPEKYTISHISHKHGTDITIKNNKTLKKKGIEIKTSYVKKKKKDATNWIFSLPIDLVASARKNPSSNTRATIALIKSVYQKQRKGHTKLVARRGIKCIKRYSVDAAFISLYVARSLIKNKKLSTTVNLGSPRCTKCNHYHRAQHLKTWGLELRKRIKKTKKRFSYRFSYFSEKEWAEIFTRCSCTL